MAINTKPEYKTMFPNVPPSGRVLGLTDIAFLLFLATFCAWSWRKSIAAYKWQSVYNLQCHNPPCLHPSLFSPWLYSPQLQQSWWYCFVTITCCWDTALHPWLWWGLTRIILEMMSGGWVTEEAGQWMDGLNVRILYSTLETHNDADLRNIRNKRIKWGRKHSYKNCLSGVLLNLNVVS